MRPWRCVGWYDIVILSWLVSVVYFNYIVHDSIHYGYRYHMTLCIGQLHPIMVYRTVLGCVLLWYWILLVLFIIPFIAFYFIAMVASVVGILLPVHSFWITHLGFRKLGITGSATTTHLPLNIGLNVLLWDSFMSRFDSLLGYSLGGSRFCNRLSLWFLVP